MTTHGLGFLMCFNLQIYSYSNSSLHQEFFTGNGNEEQSEKWNYCPKQPECFY